jgi:hypothetical protein
MLGTGGKGCLLHFVEVENENFQVPKLCGADSFRSDSARSKVLELWPNVSRFAKVGPIALLMALPLAAGMMLFSNSVDAQPRGDYVSRFTMIEMTEGIGLCDRPFNATPYD